MKLRGHAFVLRGLAPMSAFPRWEDPETSDLVEAWADELELLEPRDARL